MGFAVLFNNFEWEELDIMLDSRVAPFATDKTFGVENSVFRVGGQLVLGCVTNETLAISSKGYLRRCDTVTLVVGNDFHAAILVYTNT